jgi:hypothetical protein
MNGALLQLVSVSRNKLVGELYVKDYYLEKFINNKIDICRTSDMCVPLYIVFTMREEMNISQFVTLISKSSLKLFLRDVLFCDYNLGFLTKLNPVEIKNNSFMIKLPFSMLIGQLSLIAFYTTTISLIFETDCDNIEETSILFEATVQDTKERKDYAQKYIYHKILEIAQQKVLEYFCVNDEHIYHIKQDNLPNKLGFFIESDKKIEHINILVEKKLYSLQNCSILNDNLLYFSFCGLTYDDNKNFTVEAVNIKNPLIITSKSNNLKIYYHYSNVIHYVLGRSFPYLKFYNSLNLETHFTDFTYGMYKSIMDTPIVIKKIENMNVYNFIGEAVTYSLIENCIPKTNNPSVIRFVKCTIEPNIEIPPNIKIIVFEQTNVCFSNFPIDVMEIWLYACAITQINLPIRLKKLKVAISMDVEQLKIPFGCEIEKIDNKFLL